MSKFYQAQLALETNKTSRKISAHLFWTKLDSLKKIKEKKLITMKYINALSSVTPVKVKLSLKLV